MRLRRLLSLAELDADLGHGPSRHPGRKSGTDGSGPPVVQAGRGLVRGEEVGMQDRQVLVGDRVAVEQDVLGAAAAGVDADGPERSADISTHASVEA